LPLDSVANAKKFIETVKPVAAIFIKYEFWPNMLNELHKKEIKTILVSGILREEQLFFKWYGGFMKDSLKAFHHFFVQNQTSKKLLNSINFKNVTVSGDTRFDRVFKILEQDNHLSFIETFKNNAYAIIAGSTWKEDEALLVNYINNHATKDEKFIIAPHNIKKEAIDVLQASINKKTVLFSEKENKDLKDYDVFIIDTIGILTKIYKAADIAYVGGGLKTGLHNILEPATFGVPVIIGDKYNKFKEAVDLVKIGGCISISNQETFTKNLQLLKDDKSLRNLTGIINKKYIEDNLGATDLVVNYLKDKI
jgi:3-deoxy-D-manno-octulosonic-acid transferase